MNILTELIDRKGEVGEIILVQKYQPNWILSVLVKPVYRQASSRLGFVWFFLVGFLTFFQGSALTNEHQNMFLYLDRRLSEKAKQVKNALIFLCQPLKHNREVA